MKKWAILLVAATFLSAAVTSFAADLTCVFAPGFDAAKAQKITDALGKNSGLSISPQVAKSYPDLLDAFTANRPTLVYVGSFVQAIIASRKLGTPLVQNADGKEMYSGILICPKDQDPEAILKNSPQAIAYAIGASSGESTAKAATGGKASIGVDSHGAAIKAVQEGKAKAAVVKDWWWLAKEKDFAGMKSYRIPGLSVQKNPDNVLTASNVVPKAVADKVTAAALASSAAFGDKSVVLPFDAGQLAFSIDLMKKGGIDPLKYTW